MPIPFAAAAGIQIGLTALGKVLAGRSPDPEEYVPLKDILIGNKVGQDIRAQANQAASLYAQGKSTVADLSAASGISGTGAAQAQRHQDLSTGEVFSGLIGRLAALRAQAEQFDAQQRLRHGVLRFGAAQERHGATLQGFANMGSNLALLGSIPSAGGGELASAAGSKLAGFQPGTTFGITQDLVKEWSVPPPPMFTIPSASSASPEDILNMQQYEGYGMAPPSVY